MGIVFGWNEMKTSHLFDKNLSTICHCHSLKFSQGFWDSPGKQGNFLLTTFCCPLEKCLLAHLVLSFFLSCEGSDANWNSCVFRENQTSKTNKRGVTFPSILASARGWEFEHHPRCLLHWFSGANFLRSATSGFKWPRLMNELNLEDGKTKCYIGNNGNLGYPPKATPPRNKALLRSY